MKAVILAGGTSQGNFPAGPHLSRALLPVANRPLLAHTLGLLERSGFDEAIICGSEDIADLRQQFGRNSASLQLTYRSSLVPCGSAGCLRLARDRLGGGHFLVIEGSLIVDFDPATFLKEHGPSATATVGTIAQGTAEASADSSVSARPPAGVYALAPDALEHLGATGFLDLKQQLLPRLVAAGLTVRAAAMQAPHCSVRDLGTLLSANFQMLKGRFPSLFDTRHLQQFAAGVWTTGPVLTGPNVRLIGPILFGSNVAIASGSTLVGPLAIGENCYIGKNTLVRESVLWSDNVVEDRAQLYRCIMSPAATMAADARAQGAIVIDTPLHLGEVHVLRQARYHVSDLPVSPEPTRGSAPAR